MQAEYDEGGSIGKRYRRQDEIGTPWGVTVDHQTLEDRTVTLRDRDSLEQVRIAIDALGRRARARAWRRLALAEARFGVAQLARVRATARMIAVSHCRTARSADCCRAHRPCALGQPGARAR